MFRRLLCVALAAFVIGLLGCDKGPVSTNKDMPIKNTEAVDKKGKKQKIVEATLEDPGK